MKFFRNDAIEIDHWKELKNNTKKHSPFQTPEYLDFFNSVPGLSAEVFAIEESKELLTLCVVSYQKAIGGEI